MRKKTSYSRFLIWASMAITLGFMILVTMKDMDSVRLISTMTAGCVTALGIWLGMDMKAVVNLTGSLPAGQFVEAESGKYLFAMMGLFFLLVVGQIMDFMTTAVYEIPLAILAGGFFGIVAVYVGGMKANKQKTGVGPKDTDPYEEN